MTYLTKKNIKSFSIMKILMFIFVGLLIASVFVICPMIVKFANHIINK